MEINRCAGCMNELKPGERYCPVCGCDNLNIEQPSYALRPHTILHGRYLIGKVLGKGGFGITYIGLDLTRERVFSYGGSVQGAGAFGSPAVESVAGGHRTPAKGI